MRVSILFLCCLLLLTACDLFAEDSGRLQATSSSPPATRNANHAAPSRTEEPQPTTLPPAHTISLAVEESDLAGYEPLIELFEAQHADIDVRLVTPGEVVSLDEPDRIAALAQAADIFPYAPDVQDSQHYLLDLQPLLSLDSTFQPDDFQPGLLAAGDGPIWSLPVAAHYPVIFFDKAAFDAAGLAYPQPGWMLDDFLATAQALTLRDGDEVSQWGYVPFYVQPLLAAQLTTSVLPAEGPPRFTDPDVVAAVRWVADLFTTHRVSPWLTSGQAQEVIDDGKAAMWSGGHIRWQFMDEEDNIGVTPMPRSAEGYAIEPTRYAFAISRGTQNADAAWQLLAFLSRQPPVSDFVELVVPARHSVAAASDFWQRLPAPLAAPLQYAVEHNDGTRATTAVLPALTAVVEEGQSVADALAQAQLAAGGQVAEAEAAEPIVVATPPPEETGSAVAEIFFITTWSEASEHAALARTFNQARPHVKVTVRSRDSDLGYYQQLAAADCFAESARALNQLTEMVRPLDPLLELDSELTLEEFYPGAVAGLTTQQGELLGLPGWIYVPLMQYNQERFVAAGLTEPPPDWTLAQFLQVAQALTDPSAEQYGYIDWDNDILLGDSIALFGIELIVERDGVPTIDFAAATPLVSWYVDLVARYGVHPVLPGDLKAWGNYRDRNDLFHELAESGKVAMWSYDPYDQELSERLAGNVETGLVPMPVGPSGYSFSIPDDLMAYYIAAETLHPQACWQWLTFLVTQPTASPNLAAHIATAQSAEFAEHVGSEEATALLAAIADGSPQATWSEYDDPWLTAGGLWLTAAAEAAAKEEATLESALAEAEEMFLLYRECVIDQQAFESDAPWPACAVEVDPELEGRYTVTEE